MEGGDDFHSASGTTVPANGAAGFATGCLFTQTDGATNTAVYVNNGSNTSANFDPLATANTPGTSANSEALVLDSSGDLGAGPLILSDVPAGSGITTDAAAFGSSVEKIGTLFKTTIVIDLAGLRSGGTADDIIGGPAAAANCHLGQITAAKNGAIFATEMLCIETPATGDNDIDLWSADESTGVEDTVVTALTNQVQINDGGDLTAGTLRVGVALPVADQYLYLAGKTGDKDAAYTTGVLRITLWGS